jgi:hypothetical protein
MEMELFTFGIFAGGLTVGREQSQRIISLRNALRFYRHSRDKSPI